VVLGWIFTFHKLNTTLAWLCAALELEVHTLYFLSCTPNHNAQFLRRNLVTIQNLFFLKLKWPALSSSSRELNCSKQIKKRLCCEQVNPPLTNFNSLTFFSQKKTPQFSICRGRHYGLCRGHSKLSKQSFFSLLDQLNTQNYLTFRCRWRMNNAMALYNYHN